MRFRKFAMQTVGVACRGGYCIGTVIGGIFLSAFICAGIGDACDCCCATSCPTSDRLHSLLDGEEEDVGATLLPDDVAVGCAALGFAADVERSSNAHTRRANALSVVAVLLTGVAATLADT